LSDFYPHGKIAQLYGVLRSEGTSERAIFVIDKQGVIRYVDVHDIDQQPDNEELFRVLAEIEPELAAAQMQREAPAFSQAEELQAEVVMYCTSWCPDCRRAREFFRAHHIDYQQINIMHDREAAQRLREWTGGDEITPTFTIHGTVVIGYSEAKLRALLGI
jgi:glutaredoxin